MICGMTLVMSVTRIEDLAKWKKRLNQDFNFTISCLRSSKDKHVYTAYIQSSYGDFVSSGLVPDSCCSYFVPMPHSLGLKLYVSYHMSRMIWHYRQYPAYFKIADGKAAWKDLVSIKRSQNLRRESLKTSVVSKQR